MKKALLISILLASLVYFSYTVYNYDQLREWEIEVEVSHCKQINDSTKYQCDDGIRTRPF